MTKNTEIINKLCDFIVKDDPTTKRWGWGEGLLAYSLILWDVFTKQNNHIDFSKKYIDYYFDNKPEIDCSDRVAPALASNELFKLTNDNKYQSLTFLAVNYIVNSDKIVGDIPNHFGTSKKESNYPLSIWVDSMMMFSLFTSIYGSDTDDDKWLEFAYRQVCSFETCLMNKDNGLWYHSYWVNYKKPYPSNNMYWARGNGWICFALPSIYEKLKDLKQKEHIKNIFKKTIDGILKYQQKDGSFKTLLTHKETYKETSGTALIAGGIYKAISLGMLDDSYLLNADNAYDYCLKNVNVKTSGVYFNKISGPTVPHPKYPYLWYVTRKRLTNANYGVAALILATINKETM